jgi:hypothetical protein
MDAKAGGCEAEMDAELEDVKVKWMRSWRMQSLKGCGAGGCEP